jgi:hypothetical protein
VGSVCGAGWAHPWPTPRGDRPIYTDEKLSGRLHEPRSRRPAIHLQQHTLSWRSEVPPGRLSRARILAVLEPRPGRVRLLVANCWSILAKGGAFFCYSGSGHVAKVWLRWQPVRLVYWTESLFLLLVARELLSRHSSPSLPEIARRNCRAVLRILAINGGVSVASKIPITAVGHTRRSPAGRPSFTQVYGPFRAPSFELGGATANCARLPAPLA